MPLTVGRVPFMPGQGSVGTSHPHLQGVITPTPIFNQVPASVEHFGVEGVLLPGVCFIGK